ncbi:VOC family protein [Alkalimonas sp.]|uniref:VOC family protein n=1 Tax=Alkalimonas sp. TaxID=1872453 RepID=UPI00263AF353|nr:VOC family protein [Alkalimonas sp.]MCC5825015.1 VOC family protein [Alkalimonas sp.]
MTKKLQHYLLGLQHVGFVVADLEQALLDWQRIYGLSPQQIRRPEGLPMNAPVQFAFIDLAGQEFELMQPLAEPFLSLLLGLKSGQAGINHLAWRVRDLSSALATLEQQGIHAGYVTADGPVQYGTKRMLYLDPATTAGQLIELIELIDTREPGHV